MPPPNPKKPGARRASVQKAANPRRRKPAPPGKKPAAAARKAAAAKGAAPPPGSRRKPPPAAKAGARRSKGAGLAALTGGVRSAPAAGAAASKKAKKSKEPAAKRRRGSKPRTTASAAGAARVSAAPKNLAEELASAPGDVQIAVVPDDAPRVLAVHPDVGVLRLVREALAGYNVGVDTSPTPERAFEVALQREYHLFIFALEIPRVPGEVLYHMIDTAYRYAGKKRRYAPGVIFTAGPAAKAAADDLARDARVKAVISEPLERSRVVAVAGKSLGL